MQPPAHTQVNIVKQPDYRDGYANSVQVQVSLWDFFLQFGVVGPRSGDEVQLDVFQGVYLSPQQAKALSMVLNENLKQYESAFGPIKIDQRAATPGSVQ